MKVEDFVTPDYGLLNRIKELGIGEDVSITVTTIFKKANPEQKKVLKEDAEART